MNNLRVLIVEDSLVIRQLLRHVLEEAGFEVIGEAGNGLEAVEFVSRIQPDVITMDVHMPVMDGYSAARRIMESHPIPIVVVTASSNIGDSVTAMQVLEAGAITVLQKPQGPDHPHFQQDVAELVRTLKIAAEVRLVRRRGSRQADTQTVPVQAAAPLLHPRMVLIGASTGGPAALKTFLSHLHPQLPWPVLIVQHISPGFLPSLCEWLNLSSAIPVRVAEFGETVQPGHAYLAPDLCHMQVDGQGRVLLSEGDARTMLCPSVAQLFSGALRYLQGQCIAILFSGMGQDGVEEMLQLRQLGALTLAQHPDTVVVNGMPGEAVRRGAASQVLTPEQMAELVLKLGRQ
ncbi:chemotaxis-specific protein-glutamate methyltransferase CheB [Pokkaliibacter sp. MBI-7]|uniref:chemotaxis-specific protein-glutamate methyltransferase CheB n=1 Tax=Pokkaliibacter sp. MBI-7 TaxID=3040600 RepID=UPI00244818FC|nr:chemotaxis-specific protein-glutamate methyltransferase CheB [Pokkaliibacter sp. MBI-7]MDH2432383.1 chemotaxis-specific protein-glutamate methyltransferase CheB [Pokkaliibacter sp. MBI-7]